MVLNRYQWVPKWRIHESERAKQESNGHVCSPSVNEYSGSRKTRKLQRKLITWHTNTYITQACRNKMFCRQKWARIRRLEQDHSQWNGIPTNRRDVINNGAPNNGMPGIETTHEVKIQKGILKRCWVKKYWKNESWVKQHWRKMIGVKSVRQKKDYYTRNFERGLRKERLIKEILKKQRWWSGKNIAISLGSSS